MYALAIDLPGIGESTVPNAPSTKLAIAEYVHDLVQRLHLQRLTLVGQDVGGMIVFPYLSHYPDDLERAVIMDVVIPGIPPWEEVIRNPFIWHFAFHSIPHLPELLVTGKERAYFDYFYSAITARPEAITEEARNHYAKAYATPTALSTGFNWYRAFNQDVRDNREVLSSSTPLETPLLYLRGDHEGDIQPYLAGFTEAGFATLHSAIIPNSGHFAVEEQPEAVWQHISAFIQRTESTRG
jgi:pimeloyl-ACP methyl ester carboxylesterase